MQQQAARMGEESIPRLLWRFTLPATVGTMVFAAYNIVDRIYLGHFVGPIGVAATGVTMPLMLILMAFGMLVAHGSNALISIRLGERRPEAAEEYLGQAVTLLLIISVVFMAGGLIFLEPLLRLFGATETILPAAAGYMRIILLGTFTHEISFAMNNFIRGEGNPRVAMLTMIIGAGINLVLDPLFIYTFGWGVEGAAAATVLAQTVSATWVMWYFVSGRSQLKIRRRFLRLRLELVRQIAAVGSPPLLLQLANCLITTLIFNQLRRHGGDVPIAAMSIIFSVNLLFFMPVTGLCMGMQPIVGYNLGAQRYDRVRRCLMLAIGCASVIGLSGGLLVQSAPAFLIGLFGKSDANVLEVGAHALRIQLLLLPVVGFQVIGAQYFQAIGRPRSALFLTMSRQVLLLGPLLLLLPPRLGQEGVWWAGPIADAGACLITAVFVWRELRHLERLAGAASSAG